MKVSYYPGCTLKTKSQNLEAPAMAAMAALGVEMIELERWNCCGVVFSLADDDLIRLVAPVRDLVRVQEAGFDRVITLCSMCYNTLARANLVMRDNEEKRDTINAFMEEEQDYAGSVTVLHLLGFLRDEIGWDKLREAVKVPLTGLKVAPNYGCTLTRPGEVALDSPEHPTFMEDFIAALGATPVPFPESTSCCGAYQSVDHLGATSRAVGRILGSARSKGADAMVSACPLCEHNIGQLLPELREENPEVEEVPTFYFTQLLALALGLGPEVCRFDLNAPGAREFLESRKIIATA